MSINTQEIEEILLNYMELNDEMKAAIIFDQDGTVIAKAIPSSMSDQIDSIKYAMSVVSVKNFLKMFRISDLDQFYIRWTDGYLFFFQIDPIHYLLAYTSSDIKMGGLFFDTSRVKEKLAHIVKDRTLNSDIQRQFSNFEESILKSYRLFFSYALKDSDLFNVKNIASYWESHNTNVQIRYFERDKKFGRDIYEYMESGVAWCNRFIWFHSDNSLKSDAVQQEFKMAQNQGKKLFTITNHLEALPILAKSNKYYSWTNQASVDLDNLLNQIIKM